MLYREKNLKSTYFIYIPGSKVDGDKCKPDDTSCVHGKSNEFRFIKVLRNFSSLYGINSADGYK